MNNLFGTPEAEASRQFFYFMANRGIDAATLERIWLSAGMGLAGASVRAAIQKAQAFRDEFNASDMRNVRYPQTAGVGPSTSFRISPVDRRGRKIDPAVLAAAEEIIPRAVSQGMKLLGHLAVIANLLEEAAAAFSRRLQSNPS